MCKGMWTGWCSQCKPDSLTVKGENQLTKVVPDLHMTCTHTLKKGTWVTYEPTTKPQSGNSNFPASSHFILQPFLHLPNSNLIFCLFFKKVTPRIITWNSYFYPRYIAPENVPQRLRLLYTNVHNDRNTPASINKWLDKWSRANNCTTDSYQSQEAMESRRDMPQ